MWKSKIVNCIYVNYVRISVLSQIVNNTGRDAHKYFTIYLLDASKLEALIT